MLKSIKIALNKFEPTGRLFGGDIDQQVVGKYFVDEFWEMPQLPNLRIDDLLHYCKTNNIGAIIPTRDGELEYFSKNKGDLKKNGISVMVSDLDAILTTLDKLTFYKSGSLIGFPVIETALSVNDLDAYSIVIKERFGAGARNILLNKTREVAKLEAKQLNDPIFQPFIEGKEYSVDLYISKQSKVIGSIVRRRQVVQHGESQVTFTVPNNALEKMCSNFVTDLGLFGHIVLQVIIDHQNQFNIVECNCRFGGASTLSLSAGMDSFYWFLLEASGKELSEITFTPNKEGMKLIRYPEDLLII